MRATNLSFRSPKEITPTAYDARVTYDGRPMCLSSKKHTFSQAKRFTQYKVFASRTSYRLGPGSYDLTNYSKLKPNSQQAPLFKSFYGQLDLGNNGYFMVGNHTVRQSTLSLKRHSSAQRRSLSTLNASSAQSTVKPRSQQRRRRRIKRRHSIAATKSV